MDTGYPIIPTSSTVRIWRLAGYLAPPKRLCLPVRIIIYARDLRSFPLLIDPIITININIKVIVRIERKKRLFGNLTKPHLRKILPTQDLNKELGIVPDSTIIHGHPDIKGKPRTSIAEAAWRRQQEQDQLRKVR